MSLRLVWMFALLGVLSCGAEERSDAAVHEEFQRIADSLYQGHNRYLGQARLGELEARAQAADLSPSAATEARLELARGLLEQGQVERAIAELEDQMAQQGRSLSLALVRLLGIAYLRQAEVENCIQRYNAECCLFPLEGGALHGRSEPAQRAFDMFTGLLRARPEDLGTRWLLNLSAMALGRYPEGVPEAQRLPSDAFASEVDPGVFPNVSSEWGLDDSNLCGGVLVQDFDGDLRLDVMTSSYDPREPLRLYLNRGKGSFERVSPQEGCAGQLGGFNLIGGDYDNDGDVDVFVLRGAWLYEDGRIRNSLLRNEGEGRFRDVTHEAGLAEPSAPTQTGAWGDFDGDGFLDLYVGNESRKGREAEGDYPSQLFLNRGQGEFLEVAQRAGVTNDRYAKGVTVGDYDRDGDLDLYVSNVGRNRLYENDGQATFEDVAHRAGVVEPARRSFACWFFDYDQDGELDLFVTAYEAEIADLALEALGRPTRATSPELYRNLGDRRFARVAREVGLDRVFLPMGANFGDIDNDGWLDMYLTTGDPKFESLMPNVLLRNALGERFQDVTRATRTGHLQKGHGIAFADLDQDGDQDLFHQLGGFFPGDRFRNALFLNPGHAGRYLALELVGVDCNRSAIGARVELDVDGPGGRRTLYRHVGSVSSFGGSPLRQEIGLGDATVVSELRVTWPGDLEPERWEDLPLDGLVRIRQGSGSFELLVLPR